MNKIKYEILKTRNFLKKQKFCNHFKKVSLCRQKYVLRQKSFAIYIFSGIFAYSSKTFSHIFFLLFFFLCLLYVSSSERAKKKKKKICETFSTEKFVI